ncbi:MAG: DNA/RNA nuclease SfsA, partial [Fimbriimonadaceae bacterium]|nr:DNA/RNA nuclease SfsA [Alphaproteobacteria bacterium]
FLADVALENGEIVTAHCANPGSMIGLNMPGAKVWLSKSDNPKRKLAYSWELLEVDLGEGPALVGINTSHPNNIVTEAIESGQIDQLAGYETLRREVKYGVNSRIDILLEHETKPKCYVEIKNVHLMRQAGLAEFPDSITARGKKHLDELGDMVEQGHRAVMVFLVQRNDADHMKLARDIDSDYSNAHDRATARGVETVVLATNISLQEVQVTGEIPFLA